MTEWNYPRAYVVSVYDGDTLTVNIDCGQDVWIMRRTVRLVGIAARELKHPGGIEARDTLRAMLPEGTPVVIRSTGWDKYAGRIDAYVSTPDGGDVGAELVRRGYAVPWNGRGVQPFPAWPLNDERPPAG